jgi:hypothetical protein
MVYEVGSETLVEAEIRGRGSYMWGGLVREISI